MHPPPELIGTNEDRFRNLRKCFSARHSAIPETSCLPAALWAAPGPLPGSGYVGQRRALDGSPRSSAAADDSE